MTLTSWSYSKLMERSRELPSWDFGMVDPGMVITSRTKIKIMCKHCGVVSTTAVREIFKPKRTHRCGNIWNTGKYLRYISTRPDIDFSGTDAASVRGHTSPINCRCVVCNTTWTCRLRNLIYNNTGCPNLCMKRMFDPSIQIAIIMSKYSVPITYDFLFPGAPDTYDAHFSVDGVNYLIQFDHISYFKQYTTERERKEHQLSIQADMEKFSYAWYNGYRVIRIDYSQIRNMEYHIERAVEKGQAVYFSSPDKYNIGGYELDESENERVSERVSETVVKKENIQSTEEYDEYRPCLGEIFHYML